MKGFFAFINVFILILLVIFVSDDMTTFMVVWLILFTLITILLLLVGKYLGYVLPAEMSLNYLIKLPFTRVGFMALFDIVGFFILVLNIFPNLHLFVVGLIAVLLTIVIVMSTRVLQVKFGNRDNQDY